MPEYKQFQLCADDFGFNPAICKGILQLADSRRISAVSCMVNQADFMPYADKLLAMKDKVQIGLHFNLTDGYFLTSSKRCYGLKELLIKSHVGLLDRGFISKEFKAQLALFETVMGFFPDFIDGHQHVHQLPGIRQVLLALFQQQVKPARSWIRSTYPSMTLAPYQSKARVLAFAGGKRLQSALQETHISHNTCFSGIYDFAKSSDYRQLFRQWLQAIPSNTLIMCHPGAAVSDGDPIADARLKEFNYLASQAFLDDCAEYGTVLA